MKRILLLSALSVYLLVICFTGCKKNSNPASASPAFAPIITLTVTATPTDTKVSTTTMTVTKTPTTTMTATGTPTVTNTSTITMTGTVTATFTETATETPCSVSVNGNTDGNYFCAFAGYPYMFVMRISVTDPVKVTALNANCSTNTGNYGMALYDQSSSGDYPGTLLASTAIWNDSDGSESGWISIMA